MTVMKYRPDIDGMRALAVVAVVLYHMGLPMLTGGFVGVDVFFVISGYLISGIILHDVEQGRFSLGRFYERRVKRIQPALLAVVLCATVACALRFTPVDFKLFAQSVGATVTFSSNIYFFIKSGYFDPLSETKPLLHTWSLAVEEQFYLFFPLLVMLLFRYARRYLNVILLGMALGSFALSVVQARMAPTAAFYLPFDRFWELLAGAIVARGMLPQLNSTALRAGLGWLGLAAIFASYFLLRATDVFPGERALLPVLGTAMLIYAGSGGQRSGPVDSLLTLRPVIFIGKISYSIYLWHWPLLVIAKYCLFRDLGPWEDVAYLALTGLLSWASWKWVEQPFRTIQMPQLTRRTVFASTFAVTALGVLFALLVHQQHGFPDRFDQPARNYAAGALDTNPRRDSCDRRSPERIRAGDVCQIGAETAGDPTFVLIGDSFGDAIAPGIDAAARQLGMKGLVITDSGCFPLFGIRQLGHPECAAFNQAVVALLQSRPALQRVLLVGRWTSALLGTRYGQFAAADWFIEDEQSKGPPSYDENRRVFERSMAHTIALLQPRRVSVIAHIPEQRYDVPRALALSTAFGVPASVDLPLSEQLKRQRDVRAVLSNLQQRMPFLLTDVGATLCDTLTCATRRAGYSLYADDNHLSRQGALSLQPLWQRALTE